MGNFVSEKIKGVWERIKDYMKIHQAIDTVSVTAKNVSQSTDETSAPNATTSFREISSVGDPLSPDHVAAVKDYVHRFARMGRSTRGLEPEIQIKALMLGQYEVGMSCLATRFVHDAWFEGINTFKYEGPGFRLRKLLYDKNMLLDMRVERPRSEWTPEAWPKGLFPMYDEARHTEALFLVYDVTSRASFEAAQNYHQMFHRERNRARNDCPQHRENERDCAARPPFPGWTFILANKIDCDHATWEVPLEEGRQFASRIGPLVHFAPISIKTGEGCGAAEVEDFVKRILLRRTQDPPYAEERQREIKTKHEAFADSQRYWY